jgi:anti-anti-sigma factor
MNVAVIVKTKEDIVIVAIEGRFLGIQDNDSFREIVEKKKSLGYKRFIIDFSGIEWIDSAGIGSIIAAQISVGKNGGDLRLANLTERVAYYFDICNLDAIFKRYETIEEAVDSFRQ